MRYLWSMIIYRLKSKELEKHNVNVVTEYKYSIKKKIDKDYFKDNEILYYLLLSLYQVTTINF